MAECFQLLVTNPTSIIEPHIDWSGWLGANDIILGAGWTGDAGLTILGSSHSATMTAVEITGGTLGQDYTLRVTITTQAGRTEVRSILVSIRECSAATTGGATYWRV